MGAKWWNPFGGNERPLIHPNERRGRDRDPSAERAYAAFRVIKTGADLPPMDGKQDRFTVDRAVRCLRGL